MNIIAKSLIIGTLVTIALFFAAWWATNNEMIQLSYMLYWQGYFLGMLVPCKEVYILGIANCEVTTEGVIAFYAGLPVGVVVYSLLTFLLIGLYRLVNR